MKNFILAWGKRIHRSINFGHVNTTVSINLGKAEYELEKLQKIIDDINGIYITNICLLLFSFFLIGGLTLVLILMLAHQQNISIFLMITLMLTIFLYIIFYKIYKSHLIIKNFNLQITKLYLIVFHARQLDRLGAVVEENINGHGYELVLYGKTRCIIGKGQTPGDAKSDAAETIINLFSALSQKNFKEHMNMMISNFDEAISIEDIESLLDINHHKSM